MEEEDSDVGTGDSISVSKLHLSGELPSELLPVSVGSENQVVDGGEIMVEIVGSDVFVNGVSGQSEDLEGHELENRGDEMVESVKFEKSELLNSHFEAVVERKVHSSEKEEVFTSTAKVANLDNVRVGGIDSVVEELGLVNTTKLEVFKAKDENVDLDCGVKGQSLGKEEIFSSTGNDADLDNVQVGGVDSVVREVGVVNGTKYEAFKVKDENASDDLDCGIEAKIVDEKEVFAAEGGDPIVKTEAIGSNIQDENQIKFGPTHGTDDDALHGSPLLQPDEDGIADVSKPKGNVKIEDTETNSNYAFDEPGYLSPPEIEGHCGQSDLVWGKDQNHPWWPGQIFDKADASEEALNCYRDDSYLVAYFGDEAFSWNDSSALKPFRSHFSQIEKQNNSPAFRTAISSALEEVSRRVELNLACPCIPKDAYIKIGTQVMENDGVCEESSRRCGVTHSSRATLFEPCKLVEYISNLAPRASSLADRLPLAIARAQLTAFYRFIGYRLEFLENDAYNQRASGEMAASDEKKHTPMEGSHPMKERCLTELMAESPDAKDDSVNEDLGKLVSMSFERKRKALDSLASVLDKRVNHISNSFFKISECMSRVAGQLTRPTSSVKASSNYGMVTDGHPKIYEHSENQTTPVSVESSYVSEMLSQLQLVAADPMKRPNIQNSVHAFFLGFRNSIVLNKHDKKREDEPTTGKEFGFDDANDTYWKQRTVQNHSREQLRIIQSYSAEQLRQEWENRTTNLQPVLLNAEKSAKAGLKPHPRKRFSIGNYLASASEPDKRRKQESSPAELILNFADRKCVPSEISLNKIFRRFGALMESETEVDRYFGRAKVTFKRGCDAEVALSSADKFNIFGPVVVKYQIGYSPLISVKISPLEVPQFPEDETLML